MKTQSGVKNRYWLHYQSDSIEEVERHFTLKDAVAAYTETARELGGYGQRIEATVHIAPSRWTVDEYPDYALSLGPRGGVRVERV